MLNIKKIRRDFPILKRKIYGQINGLAIYSPGGQSFGHPGRITARVRLGKGNNCQFAP